MRSRMSVLAVMVVMCGGAGLLAASPAGATTSIDTPIPGTSCTLHTRVSATVDPQSNPAVDPTGTNVGETC